MRGAVGEGEHRYAGHDLETLAGLDNYYGWIIDTFRPHLRGRILEIGAGIGEISHRLLPFAESLDLVEPDADLARRLRERFASASVTVAQASLEQHLGQGGEGAWDAVVMVNVLEHVEDDAGALRGLFRALRPGGSLCLFVPALPFLFSRFDREVGHFRRYTRAALGRRIEAAGFRPLKLAYRDAPGVLPWFLLQTLAGSPRLNPTMAHLYDRAFVPVVRLIEQALPMPIGKNLIAVARKG